jgi:beta-ribofuranosylaminobenzene 5'-phosphate synthase
MIRVWTPSRLHFGLLALGDGAAWPDRRGERVLPARRFGGVGLMVERPGVQIAASPAEAWSAEGPLADRALAFALRFAEGARREQPDAAAQPQRLVVEQAPPEHVGLGVGTQLGLAVARALAETWGLALDAPGLARRVGRGLRSALGVHGFTHGGFLVESGKPNGSEGLSPLAARADFPPDWRVVLATPAGATGLHGAGEREAFALLADRLETLARMDALCRLVLLGMLPALAEGDLEAFGESLYDFNARVGEAFSAVQGGVYSGPRVAAYVDFLRQQGVRGAGQTSWGPTVFAVVSDQDQAADLEGRLRRRFGREGVEVWTSAASNAGSRIESKSP